MFKSDDRNAESFKQYIESATQTRGSVNEPSMKPTCLIIDEIDGAPQVSHLLVQNIFRFFVRLQV